MVGLPQKSIKLGNEFRVVRVSSWIVSVRSRKKDDPRNLTKQHERDTSEFDWSATVSVARVSKRGRLRSSRTQRANNGGSRGAATRLGPEVLLFELYRVTPLLAQVAAPRLPKFINHRYPRLAKPRPGLNYLRCFAARWGSGLEVRYVQRFFSSNSLYAVVRSAH